MHQTYSTCVTQLPYTNSAFLGRAKVQIRFAFPSAHTLCLSSLLFRSLIMSYSLPIQLCTTCLRRITPRTKTSLARSFGRSARNYASKNSKNRNPTSSQSDAAANPDGWQTVIGLEIHAQLRTGRKLFSRQYFDNS